MSAWSALEGRRRHGEKPRHFCPFPSSSLPVCFCIRPSGHYLELPFGGPIQLVSPRGQRVVFRSSQRNSLVGVLPTLQARLPVAPCVRVHLRSEAWLFGPPPHLSCGGTVLRRRCIFERGLHRRSCLPSETSPLVDGMKRKDGMPTWRGNAHQECRG